MTIILDNNVGIVFPDATIQSTAGSTLTTQVWTQYSSPTRQSNVTYTNSTVNPIFVTVRTNAPGGDPPLPWSYVYINDIQWMYYGPKGATSHSVEAWVGPGSTYKFVMSGSIVSWSEWR